MFISKKRGFTLIELLVVISIIALLIGILLPALSAARSAARTSQCLSRMHQHALAYAAYAPDYKGYYPAAFTDATGGQEDAWSFALWDYSGVGTFSYPENDVQSELGQDDNIFHCPVTKAHKFATSIPPTVGIVHPNLTSYTMNAVAAQYALGLGPDDLTAEVPDSNGVKVIAKPFRVENVLKASAAAMVMEGSRYYLSTAPNYSATWGWGLLPHAGNSGVLYFDGHVSTLKLEEIPHSDGVWISNNDANIDVFWTGR